MRTAPLFLLLTFAALAGPPRALPPGFKAPRADSGAAQILVGQMSAVRGRTALSQAFDALGSYFDQRPRVVRAVESVDGAGLQVLFTASLDRQPLRGFAVADKGQVKLVFDRADRFSQSLPAFTAPPAGAVQFHKVNFATGSMDLPDGWRITSTRSNVVMAEGPQGAVDFSLALQAYTPQAAAAYPARPPVVADYGDPAVAVQQIFTAMNLMRSIRFLERSPSPGWGGPAEYLHFQADYEGVPSEVLALAVQKPMGAGSWFFYYSQVRTRRGEFEKNLPVLIHIWKSWKTDDRVFQERMESALNSMKECNRIVREVNANRQAAVDRSVTAWDHHIRDTWPVEDTHTGKRYEAPLDIDPTVRRLNEIEGYERWRAVPYQELNR